MFIGLITGMLPSLFREAGEQGRSKGSYISMIVCMVVIFAILIGLQMFFRESNSEFYLVLILRLLPGAQRNRAGNEFLHAAHAAGAVHSVCRWNRAF